MPTSFRRKCNTCVVDGEEEEEGGRGRVRLETREGKGRRMQRGVVTTNVLVKSTCGARRSEEAAEAEVYESPDSSTKRGTSSSSLSTRFFYNLRPESRCIGSPVF